MFYFYELYCSNKGQGLSIVSTNKSQTSRRNNGKSPIGISRYNTQTNSFISIVKTGMILTQKRLINLVNKCSCCRNYVISLVSIKLCVSYINSNQSVELLLQSDPSYYNVC